MNIPQLHQASETPEVWVIRLASCPNWNKPAAERLQALRCVLKHSGFMPLSITREKSGEGCGDY